MFTISWPVLRGVHCLFFPDWYRGPTSLLKARIPRGHKADTMPKSLEQGVPETKLLIAAGSGGGNGEEKVEDNSEVQTKNAKRTTPLPDTPAPGIEPPQKRRRGRPPGEASASILILLYRVFNGWCCLGRWVLGVAIFLQLIFWSFLWLSCRLRKEAGCWGWEAGWSEEGGPLCCCHT